MKRTRRDPEATVRMVVARRGGRRSRLSLFKVHFFNYRWVQWASQMEARTEQEVIMDESHTRMREMMGRPLDVLERVYGDGGGNKTWVDADPKTREIAEKLAKVRAQIDALEVDEERLKAALCERIGDGYGIRGVATWGQVKGRETVTMADLKAEHPAIFASLAKRGKSYRMFRLLVKKADNGK